jgi:hypothetical protein
MASTKPGQQPTVMANFAGLLKELEELGQRVKPVEHQRPEQLTALVIKGK